MANVAKDLVLRLRSITDGFKTDQPVAELDDLSDELKATGIQASRSAREVKAAAEDMDAPGFDRAAAEAERTADRMREAAQDMGAGMRDGARDVDRAADRMRADMGEAGSEIGQEFIGNIAEGIGSGSGSVTDVVQGTLGGLTNLVATLTGPVGLAAGAASAGIGLVFASVKREADKADERVRTLIGALDELNETSSDAAKEAIFESWLDTMKEMPDELQSIVSLTQYAGVKGDDFKDALTGSKEEQEEIKRKMKETADAITENYHRTGRLTEEQNYYLQHWEDVVGEIEGQQTALDEVKATHDDINWLTGDTKTKTKTWKDEIKDVKAEVDKVNGALDHATRDRTTKVTVKTTDLRGKSVDLSDPRKSYPVHGSSPAPSTGGSYAGGYR